MKRIAFSALFVIGAAGILIFSIREYFFSDQPAPTAAPGLLALASPEPTQPPAPTATSTPDATATRQAEQLAIKAWEADIAIKNAQAKSLELENQRKAGEIIAQYDWTPTAQAKATAYAEATAQAEANAQAAYMEQETARILAAIETDKKRAELAEWQNLIIKSGVTIIVVTLIVGLVAVVVYRSNLAAWRKVANGVPDNLLENMEPVSDISPAPVVPDNAPAYPGGLDLRLFLRFCTISQLRKIAAGLQAGESFTHDRWTPSQNGMSETQFTKLQNLLCDYRAAEWNDETHKGGVTLAEKGVKFFADVLKTTSPLNQDVPNNPLPAGFEPIDRPDRPGEWGRQEG